MKTMRLISGFLAILFVVMFYDSCKKDILPAYGKMRVMLTDAPAMYQAVNVDIQKVSVHLVSDAGTDGWVDLPTTSGVYDLLVLQNGVKTIIVNTAELSTGKITQMRLLLGTNNTVEVNNAKYELEVPSGSETGIKLIGTLNIVKDQTLNVVLDFDASTSVYMTGSGTYTLRPTIKVIQ